MYIDQATLRPYVEAGLLSEQRHPQADSLRVYNYTHKVQYDPSLWDDVTTSCRGLILDVQREVVHASCMKKFFNYEEHVQNGWAIPAESPVILTKEDGWLGHLYWLNNEPWIATRGSFTSPGAGWATTWFREHYAVMPPDVQIFWRNPSVTHVFEIIAACTRIVVQYDFEGLVHLTTISQATDHNSWPLGTPEGAIRRVAQIDADDYVRLKDLNIENAEGFVVFFPKAQQRLKIKLNDYVRRHKLYIGLSVHALWEMFRDGMSLKDVSKDVPEELAPWIASKFCDFNNRLTGMEVEATDTYLDILCHQLSRTWGKDMTARQKEIALKFQEHGDMAARLFQIHKQREMLWKAVEPSGSETFRRESEG